MSTTHKIKTSMRGFKQWMDAHPRKDLTGYFSIGGRYMTNAEIRKMVSYAAAKGYETEGDIPYEELAQLLKLED